MPSMGAYSRQRQTLAVRPLQSAHRWRSPKPTQAAKSRQKQIDARLRAQRQRYAKGPGRPFIAPLGAFHSPTLPTLPARPSERPQPALSAHGPAPQPADRTRPQALRPRYDAPALTRTVRAYAQAPGGAGAREYRRCPLANCYHF
jgi:hypothetical protein